MKNRQVHIPTRQLVWTFIFPWFVPVVIIPLSTDLLWTEGWIFSVWFITVWSAITIYLYQNDPILLAEKLKWRSSEDQIGWDRNIMYIIAVVFLIWLIIMPLDAKWFKWSESFPSLLQDLGVLGLLLSFFFIIRAFVDNTYLSPLLRIQTNKKPEMFTHGVYNFVRHPMYLGAVIMFFSAPVQLGSYFGIGVGVILTLFVIMRIVSEEELLVEKLDGYVLYKNNVPYRLIPFIW